MAVAVGAAAAEPLTAEEAVSAVSGLCTRIIEQLHKNLVQTFFRTPRAPCLSHVGLWMIQTLQHDSGGVFYFPQPPTDLHLISTDLADLIHPYRSASFGERQLGAILIAPTALTVHGGLPARRHSVQ